MHHLAQLNIARALAPLQSQQLAPFMNALDEINGLGERSPGFVWRLKDDSGDATSIRVFDDELIIVNLSVWESIEQLKHFAYRTEHVDYFKRRAEWFEKMDDSLVLWWVPAGHEPSAEEAKERLEHLRANGPSEKAFTFAKPFPPPD